MAKAKFDAAKLAQGREAIEAFTSPTRCQGSYAEEAACRKKLEALKLSVPELRRLQIRLPVGSPGTTYAQRYARVSALLEELQQEEG